MKAKTGLGRGLEALLPQMSTDSSEEIVQVAVEHLRPNPYQPRRVMDDAKLEELAESIREHGVLQPIVVRRSSVRGFEIIAGERRFRAVAKLGQPTIPAIVRDFTDRQAMEIALIENLQREDLNPIEIAEAYLRIMEHFSLTQEDLAHRVGQSRSHVANLLRLLSLPSDIRQAVSRGTLSMGHARALLSLSDVQSQRTLARKVEEEGLSVRAVEQMVQRILHVSRETTTRRDSRRVDLPPAIRAYEETFRECLGTSVRILVGKNRGKIEIDYFSDDDLERIYSLVARQDK
ncbi:MAG: ParB/RepB/Spo0J family partition protein [Firmicutes bacterium]|nr:ParB/RepB/Spo0J family partition protein [Bacillota bacterium]